MKPEDRLKEIEEQYSKSLDEVWLIARVKQLTEALETIRLSEEMCSCDLIARKALEEE